MKNEYAIHNLDERHTSEVMDIFNHYIEHSFAAYFDKPLPSAFFSRLREMTKGYPAIIVSDAEEKVVGFAFLHAYHPAPSFKRTAEVTYFIHPGHTRRGLGKLLLNRLIEEALPMGIDTLVASISSLNGASIAFHNRFGFNECGRLSAVGRKFDRDFDIVYMQKKIA